jgi:CubicO group peptidase (beta-lactamase class C family)
MTNRRAAMQGMATTIGALCLPSLAWAASPALQGFPGSWVGTLQAGAVTLRLQLIITPDKQARLVSLDQGSAMIQASEVKVVGNRITISFAAVNARYEAALVAGRTLEGTFTQGGSFPLRMTRGLPSAVRGEAGDPLDSQPLTATALAANRAKSGTPGIGVGWQGKDRVSQLLVDGRRRVLDPQAVTPQDKWHIGSCTKSMTATLIARAVEAGLIEWSTTIEQTFALDLKDINPAYHKVSLIHLLSHHSGLPKDIPLAELSGYAREGMANVVNDRRKLAFRALSLAPEAAPGSKLIYSNNGYIVAAAMLERRTGKSWEELITRYVFGPLGLTSAGFGPPGGSPGDDQPWGHSLGQSNTRIALRLDNPVAFGPAGRVHISLPDWLTYLRAHSDRNPAFLSPESWKRLHTPPFTGNYALGWFAGSKGSLWHNGSNGAWYVEAMIERDSGTLAAFVSNDAVRMGGNPGKVLLAAMRNARGGKSASP